MLVFKTKSCVIPLDGKMTLQILKYSHLIKMFQNFLNLHLTYFISVTNGKHEFVPKNVFAEAEKFAKVKFIALEVQIFFWMELEALAYM